MPIPTNPELLKMPFAADGDKNSIPETTSPTTGLFSQQYGFQSINSLPLTAGGKAISRLDYNGAMYMLSNLLYYMQRGYTFVYDDTMDYLVGCQVLDPNDGQVYICTADAVAGTGAPSVTPANWEMVPNATNLDLKVNPTFDNVVTHKETFTSSGSFTAPVTGLYKVTLQGGGGGGGAGSLASAVNKYYGGGGGGSGANLEFYEKLTAGTTYSFTIGAGGAGGTNGSAGTSGGTSSIVVNSNNYIANGGDGGHVGSNYGGGGHGGDGTINEVVVIKGFGGGTGQESTTVQGVCGGAGGGVGGSAAIGGVNAKFGGGGYGGGYNSAGTVGGGMAGGDGYITFEWLDTSLL